jgi:O-antigen ligase
VYPLNYRNGLAIFAALALPFLLSVAVSDPRAPFRGLALTPFPVVAIVLFFTSSRGGVATAVLAVTLFVVISHNRWRSAFAATLAVAAGVAAVAVALRYPVLANGPFTTTAFGPAGRNVAIAVALIATATGVLHTVFSSRIPRDSQVPRVLSVSAVVLVLAAASVGIAAAHPRALFDEFRSPSLVDERSVREHVFSSSGNERWQLWASAVDEFRSKPWIGRGAGSFEAWWAQHGPRPVFVVNAHSLYLETAGDLGIVGLGLLAAPLLLGLAVGLGRLRRLGGARRTWLAAPFAAYVGYLAAAGEDWTWQLPAITMVALICLALLTSDDDGRGARVRPRPPSRPLRIVLAAIAVAAIGCESVFALADRALADSHRASARGDLRAAARDAARARDLAPWAASPYLQLALVLERANRLGESNASIRAAAQRAPTDWRIWLIRARIEAKLGWTAAAWTSLAHAARLNPHAVLFAKGP